METLSDLGVDDYCAQVGRNLAELRAQAERFRMLEEDLLAVGDAVDRGIALAQAIIKSLGEIGQAARLETAAKELHATQEARFGARTLRRAKRARDSKAA
jgi:hypothetical protein